MYKILIVDDELIERKGLTKIIEKKFKKMVEIQSASNGKMAIEMAKQFLPDIIFMDIKMPGMSGIDAIKEIRKDQLNVNVVIISAFDSFKYAQEAINVGAYEYLLKPVKREKIINCINRIIKFYDEEKRNQIKKELMENSNIKSINLIKENVFDYIIRNEIDKIKKIEDLNVNIINLRKGVSLIIEIPEFNNQISMYIQDYFDKNYNRHLLKIKNNYFMFFIERNNDLYKNKLKNLYKNILEKFDIEINMVFSEYNKMEEINKVYQNNLRKIYYQNNIENKNVYPIELENKLIEKVNLNILEESMNILESIFSWIDANILEDSFKLRYLTELEVLINRILFEKLNDSDILKPVIQIELTDIANIIYMKNNIKKKLSYYINKSLHENNSNIEDIINSAKFYISNNYMKDITLDMVATEMCVSTYYFSKLFKKEAGINFIDYLTKERIDNAKYLIRNTNKSIKQISGDVGYNDSNYFSRVFKKSTGYSPSAYKKI